METPRRVPPPTPRVQTTPPTIEKFPSTLSTEEGRQILLKVSVKGQPSPTFTWYHEGELVYDDYAHEVQEDGSLLIITVEERHKGTYNLVANNSVGTTDRQLILKVASEGSTEAKLLHADANTAKIGPILVSVLGEFVADGHAKTNKGFKSQFTVSLQALLITFIFDTELGQL